MIRFPQAVQLLTLAQNMSRVLTDRRVYTLTIEGQYKGLLCRPRTVDRLAQRAVEGGCDWRDLEAKR